MVGKKREGQNQDRVRGQGRKKYSKREKERQMEKKEGTREERRKQEISDITGTENSNRTLQDITCQFIPMFDACSYVSELASGRYELNHRDD